MEKLIPLTQKLVQRYPLKYREELLSVAYEAMCIAYRNYTQGNLEAYVTRHVQCALREAIRTWNQPISIPRTTYYRKGLKFLARHSADNLTAPPELSSELLDVINSIAQNDLERRIIDLRLQYYTYEEVACRVGLSTSRVFQLCTLLWERFNVRNR